MAKRRSRQKEILSKLNEIEDREERIERREREIEQFIDWKWVHGMQLSRAFVGSVLGIVLSSFLFGMDIVNSIGFSSAAIMFGIAMLSAFYVSYKTERGIVSHKRKLSFQHTLADVMLYIVVAFAVSYILLYAFSMLPVGDLELIRVLMIFSLPAIAGALTLTLI